MRLEAIEDNDMAKLKFFLDICEYWTTRKSGENHRGSGYYSFPEYCFRIAVELGRVELLGEIIKRTGAGLPLEHLVKDTGMELKVKPEYYQGLTVYGKKRYVSPVSSTGFLKTNSVFFGTKGTTGLKPAEAGHDPGRSVLQPPLFCSGRLLAGSRRSSGSSATPR